MSKLKNTQIILFLTFIIIFCRFFYLQIYQYSKYTAESRNNSIRKISLHAPRGIIYDRNEIPLVDNRQIYDLSIIPFDVTDQFNYNFLSNQVGISSKKLRASIIKGKKSFNRFRPIKIKRHIDFEARSHIEENKLYFPGIIFSEFPARTYPNSANLTHVLGYLRAVTDPSTSILQKNMDYKIGDVYGFSGIERVYESYLRGLDGTEYRLVDIYGLDHGIYTDNPGKKPIKGKPLNLSIDSKLQSLIEELFKGKKGAAICMIPSSGEVLAFISAPDYDLNSFAGPVPKDVWNDWNTDTERPLINRGVQGLYPPGSTFKLIAAALAIEKGIMKSSLNINCTGVYKFGDRDFHCWNTSGHGEVNMDKAIRYSCNIFFYNLIQKLSFDDWQKIAQEFKFGEKTGIDLFGEKKGLVPSRKYMNNKYGRYGWATGNLLTFVIGQGDVLVTPIQVAQMMNIIATRGQTKKPHLLYGDQSADLNTTLKPSTWDFLQRVTWDVVNSHDGTGRAAKIEGGDVHGKTGTSQNPHGEDHSWFAGYLVKDGIPILSLAVLVEHGGKGSVEAASISHKIFKYAEKNISL